MAGSILTEARRGKNIRHMVEGLFRQSVFGRLAGYEDVNNAERLSLDPAMRTIVNCRGLALSHKLGWPGSEMDIKLARCASSHLSVTASHLKLSAIQSGCMRGSR